MLPFTDEELRPIVTDVIEKSRVWIQKDGGDVKIIDIVNGVVFVQLQGACVGCGSAGTTLKFGIELELKKIIHPDITVMNVPHGWEERLDQLG
ncbi:NifU family protein [Sulfurovum sp. bin170]|uniref:NifU family protein n=1 Tax=Sulfurovum sp. bin170 TaxID=2695268 RepID=UPI0013E0D774|nr:NifU family protein [Sulfurovum sp. bin170]